MLRNNAGKAPQPRVVKPPPTQQLPPNNPTNQQPPHVSLGLTEPQYKSYMETKRMIGSRVDDQAIIRRIKEDMSVREIVNALSQLSISQKSNPIIFSKLSASTNPKEKQVAQFPNPSLKSLTSRTQASQHYFSLQELYKFNEYQSNFKPQQYR